MACSPCPELNPGADAPFISAAGNSVVVHHPIRPERLLCGHDCAERDHLSRGVASLQLNNVFRLESIGRFCLDVHLIGATKAIEIVYVQGPQVHLHGLKDVLERDAIGLRLLPIDVRVNLRHVHIEAREQAG